MKRALVLLVVLLLPRLAAADPVALDYKAADPSCIDAARFADQVSAKLGFVPWDPAAPQRLRVRITVEGRRAFSGTLRNVDGTAKVFDGATCNEVTANLAMSAAAVLDRRLGGGLGIQKVAAPAPAPEASPVASNAVPVSFVSAEGRRIDVSLNTGGGIGHATNGQTVVASYFAGLCTAPCTAELPRGRHYLSFRDPDARASGGGAFLFDEPATLTLKHRSRGGLRKGLFAGGLLMLAGGIAAFVVPDKLGAAPIVMGSLGISLGGTLMLVTPFVHDTFDVTHAPSR